MTLVISISSPDLKEFRSPVSVDNMVGWKAIQDIEKKIEGGGRFRGTNDNLKWGDQVTFEHVLKEVRGWAMQLPGRREVQNRSLHVPGLTRGQDLGSHGAGT